MFWKKGQLSSIGEGLFGVISERITLCRKLGRPELREEGKKGEKREHASLQCLVRVH